MDLTWVGIAAVLPVIAGVVVAFPLWWARVRDEMGTIAGAGVVLLFAVFFIAREFGEVQGTFARCIAAGRLCRFTPEPFTRYAIYAGIAMLQVFLLFVLGLQVEERLRRRDRRRT
jgi:hypothetical protein